MVSRLIASIALIVTLAIGLVRLLMDRRSAIKRNTSVHEYYVRFTLFVGSNDFDSAAYTWLTKRAPIIQEQIGMFGLLDYTPPGGPMIRDLQVLVNFLPEIRRAKARRSLEDAKELAANCMESLLHYIGYLDVCLAKSAREIRNPFVWLREGVQFILLLPFSIIHWLGLTSQSPIEKIKNSGLVRVINGLITFGAFLVDIFTIWLGWDELTEGLTKLCQMLL